MVPPPEYLHVIHTNVPVRDFLHKLYQLRGRNKEKRRKTLSEGSAEQLDYAMITCHYLLRKEIAVQENPHGKHIRLSKKVPHLVENFLKDSSLKALIRGPKSKKVEALMPISCFHQLFWLLFNEPA